MILEFKIFKNNKIQFNNYNNKNKSIIIQIDLKNNKKFII